MKYNDYRRQSREIRVGNIAIGGKSPISVQSMTNTDTHNVDSTYDQAIRLRDAGCDIIRITAPDVESANTFAELKRRGISTPSVADIHFDYKIALAVAKVGVDKIRINPGNIGNRDKIREVVLACRERDIPIRIGVNSGSLEEGILKKYGSPTAEALCESAMRHIALLEKYGFEDIAVSIKASNVETMVKANKLLAKSCPYNIHLGVTEAGSEEIGTLKSAMGIGALLCDGIGDTVRVSLTADPTLEIGAAKRILSALEIEGQSGMKIVSCPTCGRTKIDLISLVHRFEEAAKKEGLMDKPVKVALMGCVVNGPGEAREADIGIAGGIGEGLLFAHGEIIEKIPEEKIIATLRQKIKEI